MAGKKLKIAFIHPDLGIGGAERLVVDAALGLQNRGHTVHIYTSHHDPSHCFEETANGTLKVYHIKSPFPRSLKGKLHIVFAVARQLHLTQHLLFNSSERYDVFFIDQLSACIPFLRSFLHTRTLFYCHFPDKLLANGELILVDGEIQKRKAGAVKSLYRMPMDWLEEVTTAQSDVILANSKFTARVTRSQFPSIHKPLRVVYPGINVEAYFSSVDIPPADNAQIASTRPTFISLNRFEKKKNAALAIKAFALFRSQASSSVVSDYRLVLAGGYDPRLEDNVTTLKDLVALVKTHSLSFNITTPSHVSDRLPRIDGTSSSDPDVLFLLNFTSPQRSALLKSPNTAAFLYTPANEHFGIGPVEAMLYGIPVVACNSGGPTESVVDTPEDKRTGWLREPEPEAWASALGEIVGLSDEKRQAMKMRAVERAKGTFGMDAMAESLENALQDAVAMGLVPTPWTLFLLIFTLLAAFIALNAKVMF
ncbi:glycosyltransferase family 4 protein [Coniophora puteana RWD-64-598 SS2]|uniref:Alpha-1,3/1,6-mannosyltransferase ALG2 n=1 Tax=Coniophora puteana (strain RWD-64-598) TaxID=741705 RepID=A0A5M3N3J2_CONPW|nr:glycosyltransferase family 4 protein [Coniophora puteana RWD-64-598 SS2]EIW85584.1 glycosyltransferase family 4 protein [Coniophora puteana RWD-64-598 SS2]